MASQVFSLIDRLEEFQKLMGVDDVAEWLGVSRFTIYRMIRRKQLPSLLVGGQRKFDPAALAMHYRKKSPESAAAARVVRQEREAA